MRKLTAFILAIIMLIPLVSCGKQTKTATPTPTETEVTTITPSETPTPTPSAVATAITTQIMTPTPTPSPEPTDTSINVHSNDPGMTEEEMNVLPVGQYKISIPGVGYLTYNNTDDSVPLTVNETAGETSSFAIVFQTTGETPSYVLCPGDDTYRVVGLNDLTYVSTTVTPVVASNYRSLYTNIKGTTKVTQDNNTTIRWYFEENADGTYKLALRNTTMLDSTYIVKYYAYYNDGQIEMVDSSLNKSTDFKIEMTDRGSSQFFQYISYGGRIALRLPPTMKEFKGMGIITLDKKFTTFTDERGQKFANDLELAYWYFYELTDYLPYENIIVKAYSNTTYMAYVTSNYNTITASFSDDANDFGPEQQWFYKDIVEMLQRDGINDWNFGCLHEMGHMFDMGQGWKFETECETDFKLAYVLYRGEAVAAPSECSPSQYYGYDNIEEVYSRLGSSGAWSTKPVSADSYNIYGHAERLILIQKEIGSWDPIVKLFHWYKENEKLSTSDPGYVEIPTTNYGKFELFISKMSEFSGIDCKALYEGNEYDIVMAKCGYKAQA